MTHQRHPTVTGDVVQVLAEHGFDGMAHAMELLPNEHMKNERQAALSVGPYQLEVHDPTQTASSRGRKTRIGPPPCAKSKSAEFWRHSGG